jgi:serine/threonine protein kinase/formylglycine-generating enzyme required for sulfatase activity
MAAAGVLIGQTLNDTYRIERVLGSGGMGAVYEASHVRLSKRFAVKMLFPQIVEHPEALARFRREAMVTSRLGHPHIVQVIDFNNTPDGAPYIVMELLDGEDLGARLQKSKRVELSQAASIFRQTALALDTAHKNAIVHRDLKPQNIFLCHWGERDDFVKVVDFGISKVVGSQTALTQDQAFIGTPLYMSPEQANQEAANVDLRTDIYALGAIVFEMLAGRPPFVAPSLTRLLIMITSEEAPPIRSFRSDLPAPIETVLARSLRKKREDRQRSVREFWDEFSDALQGVDFWEPTEDRQHDWVRSSLDVSGTEPPVPGPESSLAHAETLLPAALPEIPPTRGAAPLPQARPKASNKWLILAVAIVAVLAAGFISLLVYWSSSRRAAEEGRLGAAATMPARDLRADLVAPPRPRPGMAFLPGGTFSLGSSSEEVEQALSWCNRLAKGTCKKSWFAGEAPQRSVMLTGFYLDRHEITNRDFADWLNANAGRVTVRRQRVLLDNKLAVVLDKRDSRLTHRAGKFGVVTPYEKHPVVLVTWFAAAEYCRSKQERLPTDAEWERATRGSKRRVFAWGDAPPDCAKAGYGRDNTCRREPFCRAASHCLGHDGIAGTKAVGSYSAGRSPDGVDDLAGNVWEWVQDSWDIGCVRRCGVPCQDPVCSSGSAKVIRGGSWTSTADALRGSYRTKRPPTDAYANVGFRCARGAGDEKRR